MGQLGELSIMAVRRQANRPPAWPGLLLLGAAALLAVFGCWVFDARDDLALGEDPSPVGAWIAATSLVVAAVIGPTGALLLLSRGARERLRNEDP